MTSTNKRDSQREKNDARRDAGGEVDRWHATGDFCYPAEIADDGEFVEYELFANVERALAESRAEVDSLRSRLEDTTRDKLNAEARAERLAGLLREVSRNGWGKQSLEDGMHKTPLLQRIDAALEQEPQE